jgi:hypothetical protein
LLPEPFWDAPHDSFAYLFLALIFIRLVRDCIFIIKLSALSLINVDGGNSHEIAAAVSGGDGCTAACIFLG